MQFFWRKYEKEKNSFLLSSWIYCNCIFYSGFDFCRMSERQYNCGFLYKWCALCNRRKYRLCWTCRIQGFTSWKNTLCYARWLQGRCSGWSCRNRFTGRIHIRIHYMNRCLVLNSIILKKIKKTTYKAFLLLTYYCLLLYNLNTFMERCLSGRKYLSWKQACRKIPGVRIPLAPYLKQKYLGIWRRGRAVIQRFAKPSVPKGPGRFNPCRLRY